jgi:chemotaxis family two-component system sensor kinase Cph1
MTSVSAFDQAKHADCENASIHAPGTIQAHGLLLVLSEPDLCIRQVSENISAHLRLATSDVLGMPLSVALSAAGVAEVKGVLAEGLVAPRYLLPVTTSTGDRMDAVIHRTKAGLILEMERSIEVPELDIAGMLGRTLTAVHFAPSLVEACNEAVRGLRAITGFDRTMIYRFRNDGSGAVIAEDRREDLVAFLGLHFPASDIPQPARQLFVINPLRQRPRQGLRRLCRYPARPPERRLT